MKFHVMQMLPSLQKNLQTFLFGTGELERHASVMKTGDSSEAEALALQKLKGDERYTRVLCVEDFGTRGLGGILGGNGTDDHFSRLVYFFGQTHDLGSTAGGAFGFGKSVYSIASSVRTVLYYSRPADVQPSRFIAVSLFPGHSPNPSFPVHPLEGDEADDVAESIGMTRRTGSSSGTSLMVLDCDYSADDLRLALEKWWWPRLVQTGPDGLIAKFYQDGAPLPPPNPIKNPQVAPFVQAYRHMLDGGVDTPNIKTDVVRSIGNRILGKVVLKSIEVDPSDVDDEDAWYVSTVAMFRGPRLVVRYAPLGTPNRTPFAGVFSAEPFMDEILRRSENPAHSDWDPVSSRLNDDTNEQTFVSAVERRCRVIARGFQDSFESRPIHATSRMHVLQDLLGRLLLKGTKPGALPPSPPRPVSISVHESRLPDGGVDQAIVEISVKHPGEELPARLQVMAHLLGDANRSSIGQLTVELFDSHQQRVAAGNAVEYAFTVPSEGKIRFMARAESPSDSPVRFVVTVTGRET
jgi:hypothetical protein